jgi:hypothetical protein
MRPQKTPGFGLIESRIRCQKYSRARHRKAYLARVKMQKLAWGEPILVVGTVFEKKNYR